MQKAVAVWKQFRRPTVKPEAAREQFRRLKMAEWAPWTLQQRQTTAVAVLENPQQEQTAGMVLQR